ncbi:MAG TPA: cytochrome c [Solirubrobacteraceae bacterium]|nr:cytochrome c [Solirubrobacteraceae bacterium]
MATLAFVLFFIVLGLAVVLAAMKSGRRGPLLSAESRAGRRVVVALTIATAALFGVGIPVAVGFLNGDEQSKDAPAGVQLTSDQKTGREIFGKSCAQCHTLKAANAVATVGPSLDALRPPKELVEDAIEKGRARGQGQMPALLAEGREARQVADFVATVAGR